MAACRTTFRGLRIQPGQIEVRYEAPVPVEVYRQGKGARAVWRARIPPAQPFPAIRADTYQSARSAVACLFREQVEEWRWEDANGKPAGMTAQDTVHAMGPDKEQPLLKNRIRRTLCGMTVRRERIDDARVNCPECLNNQGAA